MASVMYNLGKVKLLTGAIDLDTDTIKVALVTSSYTPNIDTDEFYSDITNEVANGNGYTTGGETLTTLSVTADTTNDRAVVNADSSVWSSATFTARGAVIYKSTGTAGTSPLIAYIDFGADKSPVSGTLTIDWNDTTGIFYW